MTFAPPIVATHGADDPAAPLVVLLHGRGSNEQDILDLAAHLPAGPQYAAVRAPIAEGSGYAWFANRGIGRPVADSLRSTMDWFRTWLDRVAPAGRPVILAGFSGGAAFAGGLALSYPARFSGLAVLFGTLPFDADIPVEPGQLRALRVLVARGDQDRVIPAELLDRTWNYLTEESGAVVVARRTPGGHGLTTSVIADLGHWIATLLEQLVHLSTQGAPQSVAETRQSKRSEPGGTIGGRQSRRSTLGVPRVHGTVH